MATISVPDRLIGYGFLTEQLPSVISVHQKPVIEILILQAVAKENLPIDQIGDGGGVLRLILVHRFHRNGQILPVEPPAGIAAATQIFRLRPGDGGSVLYVAAGTLEAVIGINAHP